MAALKKHRFIFLFLAIASLIIGVIAGLARIGWTQMSHPVMIHHGGIMVGGFLGTLISLEKIIPLKQKWLYVFPAMSGTSVILFLFASSLWSFVLLMSASIGLSAVFLIYLVREKTLIYGLMLLGGISWTIGNLLMLSRQSYPAAIAWWMGFALYVITAERIELMKFLPVKRGQKMFFVSFLLMFLAGSVLSFHGAGSAIAGVSLIACSMWLMKFDLIGITIKKTALPRFVATALLCGYVSLLFAGIFFIAFKSNAFAYDITVHAFFIGFVFSMIFAHAPIIFPGVIGSTAKPYHPGLYFWLVLLHASWIIRTIAGLSLEFEWRRTSGLLSAIAIAGYIVTMALLTTRAVRAQSPLRGISVR